MVDLVNDTGKIVRSAVSRATAETLNGEGLHIPIIGCVILNSLGEVLVHERAEGKRFAGSLDHVYGAMVSGETPEQTAERECDEELGVKPRTLIRVRGGLNVYNYYQYLFVGITDDVPRNISQREVAWAKYMPTDTLESGRNNGTYTFTHNFFTDMDAALAYIANSPTKSDRTS